MTLQITTQVRSAFFHSANARCRDRRCVCLCCRLMLCVYCVAFYVTLVCMCHCFYMYVQGNAALFKYHISYTEPILSVLQNKNQCWQCITCLCPCKCLQSHQPLSLHGCLCVCLRQRMSDVSMLASPFPLISPGKSRLMPPHRDYLSHPKSFKTLSGEKVNIKNKMAPHRVVALRTRKTTEDKEYIFVGVCRLRL